MASEAGHEIRFDKARPTWLGLGGSAGPPHFLFLVNRDALAVFRDIYKFIEANYCRRVPLWAGARQEMEHALGLLPLMSASWIRSWSPVVVATDASEHGFGVCESVWPLAAVRQHGQVLERSRFKRDAGRGARESFFNANHFVLQTDGKARPNTCEELDGGR